MRKEADFYDQDMKSNRHAYEQGQYRERNLYLAQMIARHNVRSCIEIAASEGDLCDILIRNGTINRYYVSDFSFISKEKGYLHNFREWLYVNRHNRFMSKLCAILGITIRGNRKKWNTAAIKHLTNTND